MIGADDDEAWAWAKTAWGQLAELANVVGGSWELLGASWHRVAQRSEPAPQPSPLGVC